jgi:hypothetical protein
MECLRLATDEALSDSQEELQNAADFTSKEIQEHVEYVYSLRSSHGVKRKTPEEEGINDRPKRSRGRTSLTKSTEQELEAVPLKRSNEASPNGSGVKRSFYLEKITLPECSCSLWGSVLLGWTLKSTFSFVDLSGSHFQVVPMKSKPKNGIWLKFSPGRTEMDHELFILIELYERHQHSESSEDDALVALCNKCKQKRNETISLQEKTFPGDSNGHFEAQIAINEQCAHRSENDYGSPNTRFYFRVQLFDNMEDTRNPISKEESSLIKVVAPGKNKTPTKPKVLPSIKNTTTPASPIAVAATPVLPVKQPAKPTTQQMWTIFLSSMQKFEERLAGIEKRLDSLEKMEKGQIQVPVLPPKQEVAKPADGIRNSGEFNLPNSQEEPILTLSQELALPETATFSP